jgi:hypothetical protein
MTDDEASQAEFKRHRIAACGISMHAVEADSGPLVLVSG